MPQTLLNVSWGPMIWWLRKIAKTQHTNYKSREGKKDAEIKIGKMPSDSKREINRKNYF